MKLNAAQLAALATGASPEVIASLAVAPKANPAGNPAADVAAPAAGAATDESGAAAPAAGAATTTAPPAAVVPAETAGTAPIQSELVTHLNAQIAAKDEALIAAKVEAAAYKAQAAAVDGLVDTLRAALGEKLVALGSSAEAAAGHTAATIAAEYARVDTVFKKMFRVGGVAAVASPDEKDTKATIDPMTLVAMQNSLIK